MKFATTTFRKTWSSRRGGSFHKVIDFLASLPNSEVKVSNNSQIVNSRTKAYLFSDFHMQNLESVKFVHGEYGFAVERVAKPRIVFRFRFFILSSLISTHLLAGEASYSEIVVNFVRNRVESTHIYGIQYSDYDRFG